MAGRAAVANVDNRNGRQLCIHRKARRLHRRLISGFSLASMSPALSRVKARLRAAHFPADYGLPMEALTA
jgi:hypothetical protein